MITYVKCTADFKKMQSISFRTQSCVAVLELAYSNHEMEYSMPGKFLPQKEQKVNDNFVAKRNSY